MQILSFLGAAYRTLEQGHRQHIPAHLSQQTCRRSRASWVKRSGRRSDRRRRKSGRRCRRYLPPKLGWRRPVPLRPRRGDVGLCHPDAPSSSARPSSTPQQPPWMTWMMSDGVRDPCEMRQLDGENVFARAPSLCLSTLQCMAAEDQNQKCQSMELVPARRVYVNIM